MCSQKNVLNSIVVTVMDLRKQIALLIVHGKFRNACLAQASLVVSPEMD